MRRGGPNGPDGGTGRLRVCQDALRGENGEWGIDLGELKTS
jgi:hypothetical protein